MLSAPLHVTVGWATARYAAGLADADGAVAPVKIILQLERASGVLVLNTAIHAPFAVKKLRRAVRQGGQEG